MKGTLASLATTVALVAAMPQNLQVRDGITPAVIKGNAFFVGDNRFYLRGVDYQPGGSSKLVDPLADADACKRDIVKFIDLGLNTIRVYSVDNSLNHDECMKALADAGIYVVLDVNTPKYSINRADPEVSYNDVYLQYVFATVEMFSKYPNTLAFFSGNEVINDGPSSKAAPYVKAVARDIRMFLRKRGLRLVPVGYSAADVDTNRLQMAQYMNCGTDDERSDFFAFNDYSWCDPSSFKISGWDQKVKNFTGYGLPLFLSEYGCNTNKRQFQEVTSLYSTDMTVVYSGGLVYEYSEEGTNYGLVKIDGNDITEKEDYTALKDALKKTPNPEGDGNYNSTGGANGCPAPDPPNWDVTNDSLPAIPSPALKYMTDGAGQGAGFSGSGSQDKGTKSTGTAAPGSGSASGSNSASTSKGAAANLRAPELTFTPVLCSAVVALFTLFGASLVIL
ncbi:1,3-beta-glucanosyltransferase [Talaromyces marneffei ATCC 18224]|uniref:1,3-beta-glucanosyltransferase n=1 Tax=Talaromyces marneffei (strain ATCC 18224 / CBS 334.59 / QM 7333) TaxID=441960 RepID=B6Q4X3_TALMQ|nr:uncharacterized protein EYB26_000652 [Talaromyces marneffei]EEA27316.1 1,3-beta-glucanosyltransferase Gel1 [Talaromyces marneffei ATCC 18224]KAE8556976.1 hypothetical protein EYB25_001682 [Talaromyces marneffei]QGA13007.1 hypothetical protein EYB26_000652 [Talaromyces marneffei]